jgi:type VI secretion system protein ImpG
VFNRYFKQEMDQLKELGAEFARVHPALAPMLSGPVADSDVERLLEGVSFQTALLRQKLDDEFPEIVQGVIRLIWPHYLRPIPATSTVAFTPKSVLNHSVTIPAGSPLASVPVEGTTCCFSTCYDVEIHPLRVLDVRFEYPSGQPPHITISMELSGINLSNWHPKSLRFFLGGNYSNAAILYLLLMRHLNKIIITPSEGGTPVAISPEFLKPIGFSDKESLFPYPSNAFHGYRILQEYFFAPEKFLFVDLTGWDQWQQRGSGSRFKITFELESMSASTPKITKDSFTLFATPVINIFPHEADPITLDHRRTAYFVRPVCSNPDHYHVYSVEKVTGFIRGTAEERVYAPFDHYKPDFREMPVYDTTCRNSIIHQHRIDTYLSVIYPAESGSLSPETLSISLTCTNGTLPEYLRIGDICMATANSPDVASFRNISPLTPAVFPPQGVNFLWRLISLLSLNYLSLAKVENFKALLNLYVFEECRSQATVMANKNRITGIEGIESNVSDQFVGGMLVRGRNITLSLRMDYYAGVGDMFLFGCVIEHFMGGYASMNSFTKLIVKEIMKGDTFQWPARLGVRPLI